MQDTLYTIKELIKASDYEKAADAMKIYSSQFSDDWDGKPLGDALSSCVVTRSHSAASTTRRKPSSTVLEKMPPISRHPLCGENTVQLGSELRQTPSW